MKNFTIFITSTNQRRRPAKQLADKFAIEYHWFMVKNKQKHNTTLTQQQVTLPNLVFLLMPTSRNVEAASIAAVISHREPAKLCVHHDDEGAMLIQESQRVRDTENEKIAQAEAAAKEERLINNAKKYTQLCDFIMILCCRILLTRLTSPPTIIFNHVMIVYCSCYLSLIHMAMHLAVQVSCSWAERHTPRTHYMLR